MAMIGDDEKGLGATMKNTQTGFTLVELMIVVAIIGILASLAISMYQTYTIRAQVAEAVNMAGAAKTPIIDAFNNTGEPPRNRIEAGMSPLATDTQGAYVASVDVVDGRVDIVFGGNSHQAIFGQTLSVTPYMSGTGSFIWRCGAAGVPPNTTELSGGAVTAVHLPPGFPDRYLPRDCKAS